jgi:hypothetical protein
MGDIVCREHTLYDAHLNALGFAGQVSLLVVDLFVESLEFGDAPQSLGIGELERPNGR